MYKARTQKTVRDSQSCQNATLRKMVILMEHITRFILIPGNYNAMPYTKAVKSLNLLPWNNPWKGNLLILIKYTVYTCERHTHTHTLQIILDCVTDNKSTMEITTHSWNIIELSYPNRIFGMNCIMLSFNTDDLFMKQKFRRCYVVIGLRHKLGANYYVVCCNVLSCYKHEWQQHSLC